MKLVSWNVNGLRACMAKGFAAFFEQTCADVVCLQEIKMEKEQADFSFEGYSSFWNSAEKKGYSGTAVFTRVAPLSVSYGIGIARHDCEGRVITLEFSDFYLVNVYTPNSKSELARLDYRMEWEDDFREYLCALDAVKPTVICGDLNVAHEEIDLKNPKPNRGSAGFTDEEREKLTTLLDAGFVDSYRLLHPTETGAYSWWSYRGRARENNTGWRIDYFLLSQRLAPQVRSADILQQVYGSDHCPVVLELD
ncbi:MAG: exodeoxyribonuclease III [Hydrogenoanaerobacterium sp.]